MKISKIETNDAPPAMGPYSQAVVAGDFIFVSGQIAKDKTVDIRGQTRAVIESIEVILKAAGSTLEDVVKTEVFLIDMDHFKEMNAIYAEKFIFPIKPARATVQVSKLPAAGALIEISCIAIKH